MKRIRRYLIFFLIFFLAFLLFRFLYIEVTSGRIELDDRRDVLFVLEEAEDPKGVAFVMHGLFGSKERSNVRAFSEVIHDAGYITLRFDNSYITNETLPTYVLPPRCRNLEEVLSWAMLQPWYEEPFLLAGHSFGALCTGLYAEAYPEKISGLILISAAVDISLQAEEFRTDELLAEEIDGYTLFSHASRLTMPVLLIGGSRDLVTPQAHQELFFDALPEGRKELHIVEGAFHNFWGGEDLDALRGILGDWIERYF